MATRNPGFTHQLRLVVEIPLFTGFWDTSLVVVWDQQICVVKYIGLFPPHRIPVTNEVGLVWDAGIPEPILVVTITSWVGGEPNKYIPFGSLLV